MYNKKKGDTNIVTLIKLYDKFKDITITDEMIEKTPISSVVNEEHGDI